ncbi:MAG TPA: transposase [Polyangiaceae bacterium]|nr:transposase [Polyangiaceae bacterium]
MAEEYNDRAEIEPAIGDLKHALGLGKMPSQDFNANHAAFLLKLLTHNLLRVYARRKARAVAHWRTPWLRRVLILRPGRLLRSGRRWTLRMAPSLIQLE